MNFDLLRVSLVRFVGRVVGAGFVRRTFDDHTLAPKADVLRASRCAPQKSPPGYTRCVALPASIVGTRKNFRPSRVDPPGAPIVASSRTPERTAAMTTHRDDSHARCRRHLHCARARHGLDRERRARQDRHRAVGRPRPLLRGARLGRYAAGRAAGLVLHGRDLLRPDAPVARGEAPGDPDRSAGPRPHAARQEPPVHGHADEDRLDRRDEEARHPEGRRPRLQHRRRGGPRAGDHESRAGEQARAHLGRRTRRPARARSSSR